MEITDGSRLPGIRALQLFRVNNHPLNPVDQFECTITAVLQRLRRLAPATVENRIRRGNARRRGRVLRSHDTNQYIDGGSRVTARQRADLGQRSRSTQRLPT